MYLSKKSERLLSLEPGVGLVRPDSTRTGVTRAKDAKWTWFIYILYWFVIGYFMFIFSHNSFGLWCAQANYNFVDQNSIEVHPPAARQCQRPQI